MNAAEGTAPPGAETAAVDGRPIRVKFLDKSKPGTDGEAWLRLFPDGQPRWGRCQFSFDRHCRDYDWLVVYDDLPSVAGERHTLWREPLACPPEHTLLLTAEPSVIKVYGEHFLRQFRWVLSAQEPWALAHHPGHLLQQPALIWFYCNRSPRGDYASLVQNVPLQKTRGLSTVCSSKREGPTLHARRHAFTFALAGQLPEIDIYGHGVRPLAEKADALDPYRYHLTIENFRGPHHWTEKLADAFLGACLPFYYGCPDVEAYFPAEALVRIDIDDLEASVALIRQVMREDQYSRRLPAILESRRRVLEDYGTLATVSRLVEARHAVSAGRGGGQQEILSRRLANRRHYFGLGYALEKAAVRRRHRQAR